MNGIVLLTGATGFVGKQVLNELLHRGKKVRLVVRPDKEKELSAFPGIESIVTSQDIFAEETNWWAEVCAGIHTVIHVAWYAVPGCYLSSEINLDCLIGTLQLAKGAARSGVMRFVGIGTCLEYDLSTGSVSTNHPLLPLTPYAAAKAAAFTSLSQYFDQQKIPFSWCRLFYLYGQGEDSRRLVPYIRRQIAAGEPVKLTSGTQIRDFLDVSEAGRQIVEVSLTQFEGAVNICSGIPVTISQLAEKIADEYGRRDLLEFGARPNNAFDPPCVVGIIS